MPFDGRTAALTIPNTLAAALTQSGIEPIGSHVLDAHKAEELHRHPAGWFYRHRVAVQIATLVLLIAVLVGVLALASPEHPVVGFAAAVILLGAVIAQSVLPVRGPAFWRERTINDLGPVHPLLRDFGTAPSTAPSRRQLYIGRTALGSDHAGSVFGRRIWRRSRRDRHMGRRHTHRAPIRDSGVLSVTAPCNDKRPRHSTPAALRRIPDR